MDQSMLLLLALAVATAVAALAVSRSRARTALAAGPADSPLAVSTEGMKVCPKCAMGNLVTARTCSACGSALKG
jgi:hypothetical protein